jgi:hypothetical protein
MPGWTLGVRRARGLFMSVSLVAIAALVAWIWIGVSTSLHAEDTLQAVFTVSQVIEIFVRTNHRWPKSWDELSNVQFSDGRDKYAWPAGKEWIQRRVLVDFELNCQDILARPEILSQAIRPVGTCYYPYDDFFPKLLESIRLECRSRMTSSF